MFIKLFKIILFHRLISPEADLKKFKPGLKYRWFHLKLYSMIIDLSRR